LKLAAAALDAGHRATIFATGDGVYGFVKEQKTAGVFDVGGAAQAFLARGGAVDL
jgi:predicted peroxiredoxin